ncbi:MAG: hypothetical protein ACE5DM_00130 [Candidatus Nanoarchaeia archaeon]
MIKNDIPEMDKELREYHQFICQMGDSDFQYLLFLREKERRARHWNRVCRFPHLSERPLSDG